MRRNRKQTPSPVKEIPTLKVVVWSSSTSLAVAEAIKFNLEDSIPGHLCKFDVTVWRRLFRAGQATLEVLTTKIDDFDFAVVVCAADDAICELDSSGVPAGKVEHWATRDNVIFEAGLSMGIIGEKRVMFVNPSGGNKVRLPSDIRNITYVEYKHEPPNWKKCMERCCAELREDMEKMGTRASHIGDSDIKYFARSVHAYPEIEKHIKEAQHNIWFYGTNFRITLSHYQTELLERLNHGVALHLFVLNPKTPHLTEIAAFFNQTPNDLKLECESGEAALETLRREWNKIKKPGSTGVIRRKFFDQQPNRRVYLFDRGASHGVGILTRYQRGRDSPQLPAVMGKIEVMKDLNIDSITEEWDSVLDDVTN